MSIGTPSSLLAPAGRRPGDGQRTSDVQLEYGIVGVELGKEYRVQYSPTQLSTYFDHLARDLKLLVVRTHQCVQRERHLLTKVLDLWCSRTVKQVDPVSGEDRATRGQPRVSTVASIPTSPFPRRNSLRLPTAATAGAAHSNTCQRTVSTRHEPPVARGPSTGCRRQRELILGAERFQNGLEFFHSGKRPSV